MTTKLPLTAYYAIPIGCLGEGAGMIPMFSGSNSGLVVGLAICLVAAILLLWGCMHYAAAKGLSASYGLLGIFGLAGLVALLCLPSGREIEKGK